MLPELKLAARVSQRFYNGQIFGDSVLERMVSLTAQSASIRELMSDLFAGNQGYRDLRARLYRILPSALAEGLMNLGHTLDGAAPRPWNELPFLSATQDCQPERREGQLSQRMKTGSSFSSTPLSPSSPRCRRAALSRVLRG